MSFTLICRTCRRQYEEADLERALDVCGACARKAKQQKQEQRKTEELEPLGTTEARPGDPRKLSFTIPYDPVPQPRPRSGQIPIGPVCGVCKQKPTRAVIREADSAHPINLWKIRVLDGWRIVLPRAGWRFEGPLLVTMRIIIKRKVAERSPERTRAIIGSGINGDVDNYAKAILDALNGKAWRDDAQISLLIVDKWAAAPNERTGATVSIAALPDNPGAEALIEALFRLMETPDEAGAQAKTIREAPKPPDKPGKPWKAPGLLF